MADSFINLRMTALPQDTSATPRKRIAQKSDFRLARYFSISGFVAFFVVAAVLYVLERRENDYFREVQQSQRGFVSQIQDSFAREQEASARRDLLLVHEAGHVNLTKLLANAMWETHVAPLVARTTKISTEPCYAASGGITPANATSPSSLVADCFAVLGKKIIALPEFAALDAKVATTIRASTVFKVKVFDMRGVTIYSSEHAQVGEDKFNNQGWRMAAGGHPASELTHRDKFSAFEGVVENRDLISSYVPVRGADGAQVVGVFEIYSDVTPFLAQIKGAFAQIAERAASNQAKLEQAAIENQQRVQANSRQLLVTIVALLIALYIILLLIVRHAQRILDAQTEAQAQFIQREEQWHHEKMSALSAMAANVAHEIGNPLATIAALAESLPGSDQPGKDSDGAPRMILEQTQRIAAKTRQITDFAATRSESREPVDVNQMVKAVCDFLAFERSFRATTIKFQAGVDLPARTIVPDHLTEALMNLLQTYVENQATDDFAPPYILVQTLQRGEDVVIRLSCEVAPAHAVVMGAANQPRMAATRRRVAAMGGQLQITENAIAISLPPA